MVGRTRSARREKKPLLTDADRQLNSQSPLTLPAETSRSPTRGGSRRIFGRNLKAKESAPSKTKRSSMDTRTLRVMRTSSSRKRESQSNTAPSTTFQDGSGSRSIHSSNDRVTTGSVSTAPLPRLTESTRDSAKKPRPFPIPTRRARNKNPNAHDPPGTTSSSSWSESSANPSLTRRERHQQQKKDQKRQQQPIHKSGSSASVISRDSSQHSTTSHTSLSTAVSTRSGSNVTMSEIAVRKSANTVSAVAEGTIQETPSARRTVLKKGSSGSLLPSKPTKPTSVSFSDTGGDWDHSNGIQNLTPTPSSTSTSTPTNMNASTLHPISRRPMKDNLAQSILSRPFGRQYLPPALARKWVIEVSSPEWDADESKWKYRILIQRRQLQRTAPNSTHGSAKGPPQPQHQHGSFTAAFTWRSLGDFVWLERALRLEFHGGLLLPDLGICLGRSMEHSSTADIEGMPVEADRLRNWLSDVLNGVRGQGELLLLETTTSVTTDTAVGSATDTVDVMRSESMEAFLYKKGGLLNEESDTWFGQSVSDRKKATSTSLDDSFFHLLSRPLSIVPLDFCAGPQPLDSDINTDNAKRFPLDFISCTSRVSHSSSIDPQDSFIEADPVMRSRTSPISLPQGSGSLAIHSEIIEAEKELMLDYRITAISALEKLQVLSIREEQVGAGWRRLAQSMTSLFSYEKEVEHAKLGDSKAKRENMPYRKIAKSLVEDSLRSVAKQKVERSLPSLEALHKLLSAYIADLSAVEPSVTVYSEAVEEIVKLPTNTSGDGHRQTPSRSATMNGGRTATVSNSTLSRSQHERNKLRLLKNEPLLRRTLTDMCRATPLRVSRIAWAFLSSEASQTALLHASIGSLKTKIDVANQQSVSKMIKRHLGEEKEDSKQELELVQKLVSLGTAYKPQLTTPRSDFHSIDTEKLKPEVDTEHSMEDADRAEARIKALEIARERVGRWDPSLAMAILKAVGVDDPQVWNAETSRELRMVSKYAIGLRENLDQVVEAIEDLRRVLFGSTETIGPESPAMSSVNKSKSTHQLRSELWTDLSRLFSGSFMGKERVGMAKRSVPSTSVLSRAGIDVNDPCGWNCQKSSTRKGSRRGLVNGRIGNITSAYIEGQDDQVEWVLESLVGLVNEYTQRIEIVEGYVYMECVGIQIEKHFSVKRTAALSSFEKKTDITAAINVATRKRLPQLKSELQAKLDALGHNVSHTMVKEMKEKHLESKTLKAQLHDVAMRRLMRAREASTERVVGMLLFWAKEEENSCNSDLKILSEALSSLEKCVEKENLESHSYLTTVVK